MMKRKMNKLRIDKLAEWQDTGVNFAFSDLFLWNHLLVEQVDHGSLTDRYHLEIRKGVK